MEYKKHPTELYKGYEGPVVDLQTGEVFSSVSSYRFAELKQEKFTPEW